MCLLGCDYNLIITNWKTYKQEYRRKEENLAYANSFAKASTVERMAARFVEPL